MVHDDSNIIREAVSMALENERRRLADQIEETIISQINLILSQANIYAQTSRAHQEFSVMASLTQNLLQLSRDLQHSLNPSVLETLGLEAALENLSRMAQRRSGLNIDLYLPQLRDRLSPQIELMLYRITQQVIETIERAEAHAQLAIHLEKNEEQVQLRLSYSAEVDIDLDVVRVISLGGQVNIDSTEITITFPIVQPIELTAREMDVMQLLAEGLSNKEIALKLDVRPRTVKFHLDNIYSKLGVNSRTEAVVYAIRHGWVRPA